MTDLKKSLNCSFWRMLLSEKQVRMILCPLVTRVVQCIKVCTMKPNIPPGRIEMWRLMSSCVKIIYLLSQSPKGISHVIELRLSIQLTCTVSLIPSLIMRVKNVLSKFRACLFKITSLTIVFLVIMNLYTLNIIISTTEYFDYRMTHLHWRSSCFGA